LTTLCASVGGFFVCSFPEVEPELEEELELLWLELELELEEELKLDPESEGKNGNLLLHSIVRMLLEDITEFLSVKLGDYSISKTENWQFFQAYCELNSF
jgi:hypothetical protein